MGYVRRSKFGPEEPARKSDVEMHNKLLSAMFAYVRLSKEFALIFQVLFGANKIPT
ncbi:uncharacterized protein PHALS_03739 [Plasmopara halstedii]|uniref:Uncharacterized protein n=1 Tax=Plasmopara halstedii TaxID=4781 RepID=A0A0P1B023_PLAHL|nr:uncharacterized protein PHALS_03739 [Plasmopara halstedii]CEG47081.1 hypothetical protein PHALS_03739 [Plasmopara halstedii]|eukprot:XP_024583450.1 hypothetical protein PHALS_03739 [Plasmopara halstedii]